MKRVIMIGHEPLTERTKSIFYIDDFIEAGICFEYWDISQCIFEGIRLTNEIETTYLRKYSSLAEIEKQLQHIQTDQTVFIVEVRDSWNSRKFYKLLSDYRCFTIRIDMYGNTILNIPLVEKLKAIRLNRLFKIISNQVENFAIKTYKRMHHIKNFDVVFSSSILLANRVPINHPDYEKYAVNRVMTQEGYIVFLDVFYPLHPDLLYMMRTKKISPLEYQNSLRSFFDKIEEKYNLPVIIAAHPKSNYSGNEFGNRRIIRGETDHLVKNANSVLLHTSNSVSYCILYKKPISLITNKEYSKNDYLSSAQNKLAISLKLPIFDVDRMDISTFNFTKLSNEERDNYMYSYLTSKETENKNNKEILLEYILNL